MPSAIRRGRRPRSLAAVAALMFLGASLTFLTPAAAAVPAVPAVEAAAAAATPTPAVRSVQADLAPVSAGSGKAWPSTGPAVAVLDTGVYPHPDLNLAKSIDCLSGVAKELPVTDLYTDLNGHGTGVSGVIAGKPNTAKGVTAGVAPGAPIVSIRILNAKEQGTVQTFLCALNWLNTYAAANRIKVVNMSLAAPGSDDGNCGRTNNDPIHQGICTLYSKGLVFTGSGGNAKSGQSPQPLSTLIPAAYNEVLAVTNAADFDGRPGGTAQAPGTCTAPDGGDRAYYTSYYAATAADAEHTIAGPGVCPYTTRKGGTYGYIQSGTSIAAAAVSGVVLNCFNGGSCVGKTAAQAMKIVLNQAAVAGTKGHAITGDPLHPVAGKYYGFMASTVPVAMSTAGASTPRSTRPASWTPAAVGAATAPCPPTAPSCSRWPVAAASRPPVPAPSWSTSPPSPPDPPAR
ncbi:hypothetical protein GIS00_05280 [Nakamurella sp. YIM 132087]|uniref:Peptidase S8/S53 domain-containing protein n=1 Tax=Nakamurella alba TaxID=2665158 RepID=A0A7K1FGY2_9ACTN|nr:S8 family serine peptidase [Nakamurella alba]MTD13358.1 hypothetical protein [Nakamurella alba]